MTFRYGALALCLGLVQTASADESFLGTKKEPLSGIGPSSPVGVLPTLQMVVALLVVVALLKWVLPGLMARFGKKLVAKSEGTIQIEESATFAGGTLNVVTVRGRTLLVASGQSGANLIADLTDQPVIPKTFMELVEEADGQELPVGGDKQAPEVDDVTAALDRLERLVK